METLESTVEARPGTSVGEDPVFGRVLAAVLAAIAIQTLVLATQIAVAVDTDGADELQLEQALQPGPVEKADLRADPDEGELTEVPAWRLPPGHPRIFFRLPPGHPPICEPESPAAPQPDEAGPASPAGQDPAEPAPAPPASWRGGPLWI